MMKCSVCRNEIATKDPAILFVGQRGDEKNICTECEKQMDTIMESDNAAEIKSAINYIYTCSLGVSDDEVARFLRQTVETNSSAVEEQETKQIKSKPANTNQKRDYFKDVAEKKEDVKDADGSFWISGLKIFTWISFVVIIVTGIISFIKIGGWTGFLTFLTSIIIAFVSVAAIMVFLKIADDISKIKNSIYKKNK